MDIKIKKQSGIYTLISRQVLPISLDAAWDFFSVPRNLDQLTPPNMQFVITNNPAEVTYAGQIITYKIGIFPLIKTNWVTEITHFQPRSFFVDEQRFGPYAMWHHEHRFRKLAEHQIEMIDIVSFKLPLGLLGDIIAGAAVVKKVRQIFESRYRILSAKFPS